MDVSIIIVNYNTKLLLKNCIESILFHTKNICYQIIVSDNGSTDGSIEMLKREFPNVVLIENKENIGFGAANNRALSRALGKYVLYLNSDTVLLNNAVKYFFDYWEKSNDKEKIGALGSNLLNENNEIIHSFGSFPRYRNEIVKLFINNIKIFVSEILEGLHIHIPHRRKNVLRSFYAGEVDYITGADLFLLNDENAYFDEKFLLYFEETDLQYSLKKQGMKRIIIEGPRIMHLEGSSNKSDKNSLNRYLSFSAIQILLSRIIYLKKNNKKTFSLFIVYFLSLMYLCHFGLILKTKEFRKRLSDIYHKEF